MILTRYAIAAAAALAVMAGWSAYHQHKGVIKERERVAKVGEATHERAKVARKKVEAKKPSEIRADLREYCRDCDAR